MIKPPYGSVFLRFFKRLFGWVFDPPATSNLHVMLIRLHPIHGSSRITRMRQKAEEEMEKRRQDSRQTVSKVIKLKARMFRNGFVYFCLVCGRPSETLQARMLLLANSKPINQLSPRRTEASLGIAEPSAKGQNLKKGRDKMLCLFLDPGRCLQRRLGWTHTVYLKHSLQYQFTKEWTTKILTDLTVQISQRRKEYLI